MNTVNDEVLAVTLFESKRKTLTHFLNPSIHSEKLRDQAEEALNRDFKGNSKARERFLEETSIIEKEGYWDAFYLMNEAIKEAKKLNEPILFRKSSLDTFVGHLLGWSSLNPMERVLPFSSLVGEDGKSVPRFALSFSSAGMEKVQTHLRDLLGKDKLIRASDVIGHKCYYRFGLLLVIPFDEEATDFTPITKANDSGWDWGAFDYDSELKDKLYAIEIYGDGFPMEIKAMRDKWGTTPSLKDLENEKVLALGEDMLLHRALIETGHYVFFPGVKSISEYLDVAASIVGEVDYTVDEFTFIYSKAMLTLERAYYLLQDPALYSDAFYGMR